MVQVWLLSHGVAGKHETDYPKSNPGEYNQVEPEAYLYTPHQSLSERIISGRIGFPGVEIEDFPYSKQDRQRCTDGCACLFSAG